MLELGVKTLAAYLLGAVLGSLVLGRLRGVDIRSLGSGNAGATNAMRTQGKLFGLLVLIIDAGKGVLAVRWLPGAALAGVAGDPGLSREWLTVACALAVVVGHVYPVWFGFRGGKGVATLIGVVGALQPLLLIPLLGAWVAALVLTGYVGLSSMVASAALLAYVAVREPGNEPLLAFCVFTWVLVLYTHRGNMARMWQGTEHRARRVWLFRSRAA